MTRLIGARGRFPGKKHKRKNAPGNMAGPQGVLEFVTGTMASGKTGQLLLRARRDVGNGKRVIVMKPSIDTRHSPEIVKSRLGLEMKCDYVTQSDTDICREVAYRDADVMYIDEIQFFTPGQVEQLRQIVDETSLSIHCYGLRTNYKRELFAGSKRMIELCDRIAEIDSGCKLCPGNAKFNMKCVGGICVTRGPEVDISMEGEEKYYPVCHSCYMKKTASTKGEF
jgi:thymidine kinase